MSPEFDITKICNGIHVTSFEKRDRQRLEPHMSYKDWVNERKIMLLMWFYIGSLIAMKAILWSMYTKYMEFLQQETHYMEEDENIILTVTDFKSKRYIAENMKCMTSV